MTDLPVKKVFFMHCRTGCSCCSYENHYRGFYKTREDAKRRVRSFLAENSTYWPLASQYALRGRYYVMEEDAEILGDGRVILLGRLMDYYEVEVADDGTVADNDLEVLHELGD